MKRFERHDEDSSVFWEIRQETNQITLCWGRVGKSGQRKIKDFDDEKQAKRYLLKAIADKEKNGYVQLDATIEAESHAFSLPACADILRHDLILRGKYRRSENDLHVDGWVTLESASLECKHLWCHGITLNSCANLKCESITTNFIEIDNLKDDVSLETKKITSRIASLMRIIPDTPLARHTDSKHLRADFIHHHAGDMNPSWDYRRGRVSVLRAELFDFLREEDEAEGENIYSNDSGLLSFEVERIRQMLSKGDNPFRQIQPLVAKMPKAKRETFEHIPLIAELTQTLSTFNGSQRELLAYLKNEWPPKLASLEGPIHDEALRIIRRKIKSPRLKNARDEFLKNLVDGDRVGAE